MNQNLSQQLIIHKNVVIINKFLPPVLQRHFNHLFQLQQYLIQLLPFHLQLHLLQQQLQPYQLKHSIQDHHLQSHPDHYLDQSRLLQLIHQHLHLQYLLNLNFKFRFFFLLFLDPKINLLK